MSDKWLYEKLDGYGLWLNDKLRPHFWWLVLVAGGVGFAFAFFSQA